MQVSAQAYWAQDMVIGNHQCNAANLNQSKPVGAELGPVQSQLVLSFCELHPHVNAKNPTPKFWFYSPHPNFKGFIKGVSRICQGGLKTLHARFKGVSVGCQG